MMTLCRNEHGFSLVEGLLSAAILGAGLLALSAMQAIVLGRNVDANELTRVSSLAADIIERMTFNRQNIPTYNNITVSPTANTCPAQSNSSPPKNSVTTRGDCLQWQALLAASGLVNVQGSITLNPIPPAADPANLNRTTVTVQVNWIGRDSGSVPRSRTLTFVTVVAPE